MLYVIMCGGFYEQWETPKQLQIVNGERIVERTIRLLRKNGCKDIDDFMRMYGEAEWQNTK